MTAVWVVSILQMVTLEFRSVAFPREAVSAQWEEWVLGPFPHHQKPVLGRHCPQLLFVLPDLIQPSYIKKPGEYLVNVTTLFLISLQPFPGVPALLILCRFKLEILSKNWILRDRKNFTKHLVQKERHLFSR